MASSLLARVLWVSAFLAVPELVVAGCQPDYPVTTPGQDASTNGSSSSSGASGSSGSSGASSGQPDAANPDPAPSGPETLLISEVRSHGTGGDGFGDDFIELYNSGDQPVTVDAAWKVHQQSAQGASCQGLLTNFVGQGQVIPSHGHFLLGGWEYGKFDSATPAADAPLLQSSVDFSLADASSIWLVHGTNVIDALCFYYDDASRAALDKTCPTPYVCKGTPISNLPHDGSSLATSSVNASLERKVGAGGLQNTGDNAADFHVATPATPQNLKSPAGP